MLSDLLIDRIEYAPFHREHHVEAVIVREREIPVVLRYALSREPEGGYAVLDAAADVVDVLRRVQQRRVVAADPGVHHERPTVRLIDPPEHGVGLRLKTKRLLSENFISSSLCHIFLFQGEAVRDGPFKWWLFLSAMKFQI